MIISIIIIVVVVVVVVVVIIIFIIVILLFLFELVCTHIVYSYLCVFGNVIACTHMQVYTDIQYYTLIYITEYTYYVDSVFSCVYIAGYTYICVRMHTYTCTYMHN